MIIGGITFIIVARLLGPSGYGVYALALGIAGFIGAFGSLNIGPYYNKHIPKLIIGKEHERLRDLIWNSLLILLLIGVGLVLIGFALGKDITRYIFHSDVPIAVISLALTTIPLSLFYNALYTILVSIGKGKEVSSASILYNTVQSVASISLVLAGFGPYGAVAGYISGLIFAIVLALFFVVRLAPIRLNANSLRPIATEIFSFSTPLTGASIISNAINNFSVIFLGSLFPPSVVGVYGVASKVGALIDTFTGSISIVLVPMFATAIASATMHNKLGKLYSNSVHFGMMFTVPVILYITALSGALVSSIFKSTYNNAALYMSLISIGILIGLIGSYASALMTSIGEVNKIFKYSAITGIAEMASLAATVPEFGAVGVIVSMFFVDELVSDYLYVNYLRKKLKISLKSGISSLALSNVVLFVVLLLLPLSKIPDALQLALGLAVLVMLYPMLLGITKALGYEEIRILRKVGDNIPLFGQWLKVLLAYAELFIRR